MSIEKERKAFEVEYKKQKHTFNDSFCRFSNGDYMNEKVSIAWGIWQASTQRKGYKLVPVEATDAQWVAAIDAYTIAMDGQDILSASAFFDIYKAMIGAIE